LVHIVFHAHRADVSEAIQQRAEQAVRKLASRLRGATDASIRFVSDGIARRIEIVLRVARRRPLVAEGAGPRYEVALAAAVERLGAHVAHVKAQREARRKAATPLRPIAGGAEEAGIEDENAELLTEAPPNPPLRAAQA
jgi:ribosome-associated translation inhibitor RaiA